MATIDQMEVVVCTACGAESWMLKVFLDGKRHSGDKFFCPNGHALTYKKKAADILKEKLEKAERQLTDLKQGRCPYCRKFVKDISAHIERMHA